jgi:hypothetical protein
MVNLSFFKIIYLITINKYLKKNNYSNFYRRIILHSVHFLPVIDQKYSIIYNKPSNKKNNLKN